MVASADKLVAMMRAASQGRAGGLMLGHNSSVSAGNLRATLISWRDAHPDVEVEYVEADRSVLLAGLDTGEIEIAILMGAVNHVGFPKAAAR
jgi:DNA-binding transcriptional LysR family regulator